MSSKAPKQHGGFILVLVLWVLLALTIAASALAAWISRTTDQAVLLADERRGQIDVADTLETLKFLFATRPSRAGGLYIGPAPKALANGWRQDPFEFHRAKHGPDDLPLDGRRWRGLGEARFTLQDESGLINAHGADRRIIGNLLNQWDVSAIETSRLIDNLSAYVSPFGSSTASLEYRAAGLPAPPQRYLLAPLEVVNVLGWHELAGTDLARGWARRVSVLRGGAFNPNVVPLDVLELHPSIGRGRANRLMAERATRPFNSAADVLQRTGVRLDPLRLVLVDGEVIRIELGMASSGVAWRYTLRLTSGSAGGRPWRLGDAHPISGEVIEHHSATSDGPPRSAGVEHPLFTPSAEHDSGS